MPLNYEVISPLPVKSIDHDPWIIERHPNRILVYERVLFFDPTPLYERVADKINPTKRHQGLQMEDIFPKQSEPLCACGCGEIPKEYVLPNDFKAQQARRSMTDECFAKAFFKANR